MQLHDFCIVYIESVKKGAKARKYFISRVIFICHPVFPVMRAIRTADVWIILDFQTMEHIKARLLVGSRNFTFAGSIE
jgi:hypothetical protein